jgi:hypothetical protein
MRIPIRSHRGDFLLSADVTYASIQSYYETWGWGVGRTVPGSHRSRDIRWDCHSLSHSWSSGPKALSTQARPHPRHPSQELEVHSGRVGGTEGGWRSGLGP